jgi:dGTP triphosphohydrolase
MAEQRKDALNTLISSVISESDNVILEAESLTGGVPEIAIRYDPDITKLVQELRDFFNNHVFKKEELARRNEEATYYIKRLFEHWLRQPPQNVNPVPVEIARFIARKTDQEIIRIYESVFTPRLWPTL